MQTSVICVLLSCQPQIPLESEKNKGQINLVLSEHLLIYTRTYPWAKRIKAIRPKTGPESVSCSQMI